MRNENEPGPDTAPLERMAEVAGPPMSIDTEQVLRIAKHRRARRRVVSSGLAVVMMAAIGVGASALPIEGVNRVAKSIEQQSPSQQLLELADELQADAEPVPEDKALHWVSRDWTVLGDGRVRIGKFERTEYPDGAIDQVESSAGPSASLDVGDPLPPHADVTDIVPMHQDQPSWEREAKLPTDAADLRAAWMDGCVDPEVGDTEYRCVYNGMQEAWPVAHDDLAAAILRLLVAEPRVQITRGTDGLGRDVIAATFDLPNDPSTSYLIDPDTGELIGTQIGTVPAKADQLGTDSSVSTTKVEWIRPGN